MSGYPPYMSAHGLISKILDKILDAKTPDRFTQDFLATKLSYGSGSAKPFIPFAKRLGLLGSDGSPTEVYKNFRNPSTSQFAIARAMRAGYAELFSRNEYVYDLDRKKLEGLIMEITGLERGHKIIGAICSSFLALKKYAEFDAPDITETPKPPSELPAQTFQGGADENEVRLNLSYTINLVLPKSDDVAVFNAIFKSLKENLLK